MRVAEDGKELARFEYHNNGQIAKAIRKNGVETFEWDGLALIERSGTKYINEPHPGGGNPILAINGDSYETIFTDMLGTSLGKIEENGYYAITKTSFGAESNNANSFFTGKPYVENLGYAFLFRNYRADMGKWLSQDLIGYPDGWNNFAYCNNSIIESLDLYGAAELSSNRAYVSIVLSNGQKYGSYISNASELNSLMSNADTSNKITAFTYTGHSAEGTSGLIINNSNPNMPYGITPYDFKNISTNFEQNISVTLNACYQGNYLDEYLRYLPDNATIIGYTDKVYLTPFSDMSDENVFYLFSKRQCITGSRCF